MAIRPQAGPQTAFMSTPADIGIYGGSAGGGKTWSVLLEPLRHIGNKEFDAVIFRRNLTQVTNPGGLWDEAGKLYGVISGAEPLKNPLQWTFASNARVRFAHLTNEDTVLDWQGSQIPLIEFDELTHFTRAQFFYMLSRNRSMSGVRPYVRATCNPDADSWVAEFIAWWIDQDTGYPIPERAGVLRYFVRVNDALIWGDTPDELVHHLPQMDDLPEGTEQRDLIKSVTFIPSKLSDNKALMKADPSYLANLLSLPTVERERLLGGNWKIRPAAGMYFQRAWCEVVDAVPAGLTVVRYWDRAATEKMEHNDPDWTVGTKLGYDAERGIYYVMHVERMRVGPFEVEKALKNTASADGASVRVGSAQDPGQAGKFQAQHTAKLLDGYDSWSERETGDKVVRFGPVSAQAKAGNVKVLRGSWNDVWFSSLEAFPEAAHDDDADSLAGAHRMLSTGYSGEAMTRHYAKLMEQRAQKSPDAPKAPALPWHKPAVEEAEPNEALEAYLNTTNRYTGVALMCARCGHPLGDTKISDGVSAWHPECR
jgi:predicted phage terminase large subunit-like protein